MSRYPGFSSYRLRNSACSTVSIHFRFHFHTQEEETQIRGIIMLNDLKGVGFKHARSVSPFHAKRIMGLLQVYFK